MLNWSPVGGSSRPVKTVTGISRPVPAFSSRHIHGKVPMGSSTAWKCPSKCSSSPGFLSSGGRQATLPHLIIVKSKRQRLSCMNLFFCRELCRARYSKLNAMRFDGGSCSESYSKQLQKEHRLERYLGFKRLRFPQHLSGRRGRNAIRQGPRSFGGNEAQHAGHSEEREVEDERFTISMLEANITGRSDGMTRMSNGERCLEERREPISGDGQEEEHPFLPVVRKAPGNRLTRLIMPMIRVLNGTELYNWAERQQYMRPEMDQSNTKSLKAKFLRWLRGGGGAQEPSTDSWPEGTQSDISQFSRQLGKYTFALTGTGAILATGLQLTDGGPHQQAVLWFSWLAGIVLGSMIGAGQVLDSCVQRAPRNVVITGSTRGLGKALAREFLRAGDNVVVASRSEDAVSSTVAELQEELALHFLREEVPLGVIFHKRGAQPPTRVVKLAPAASLEAATRPRGRKVQKVVGIACNVHSSSDVKALVDAAVEELGTVDIWINNAGTNAGAKPFVECSNKELEQVVSTNLMGSLICTREAILLMKQQARGGHVFNMDGAGSGGSATPKYAAYGATKCALRQLHASLLEECRKGRVGIHTASPGMVLTDLLLSGATLQNKQVFNIVCEQPETVARALVPRLRAVRGTGKAVNYLTPPRIVLALVTAWLRRGRWFDGEGRVVYAAEADRLRMWAEGRNRSPITNAMEMVPGGAWVSLFSSSAICAYIMLSNSFGRGGPPGT